jgi:hypothetical protein
MPQIAEIMFQKDPYGRCAQTARVLMLFLLGGHLLFRRAFAQRNLGELFFAGAPGFARYAFITEIFLGVLLVLASFVLLRRWLLSAQESIGGDDALQSGLGAPVWFSLAFAAYGAIHAAFAFSTAGNDVYLILRQSALSTYALFFALTVVLFGSQEEFVRRAAWVAVIFSVLCAALDASGIVPPGLGDRTGQYANEPAFGQMTLPLGILGLGFFIVAGKEWSWRLIAMAALALILWRQMSRTLQTVVPFSLAVAIASYTLLSLVIALRGQRNSLRRASILIAACVLAGVVLFVLKRPTMQSSQEQSAWGVARYSKLLEVYESTKAPGDPEKFVASRREPKLKVGDPEVYKLNAVYEHAGSPSAVNNIWRILIWKRMWQDWSKKNTLLGRGVGKAWFYPALYHSPFHYGDAREGLDPHNSYLNVLSRYGIAGAILFLGILATVAWNVWRALSEQRGVGDPLLEGLLLFAIYAASFAFFTVSLEGPSYSLPFWMSMGLLYARARQVRAASRTVSGSTVR